MSKLIKDFRKQIKKKSRYLPILTTQAESRLIKLSWLVWACLGLAWLGFAWLGLAQVGLAWFGLAWLGLNWLGLAWLSLAWLFVLICTALSVIKYLLFGQHVLIYTNLTYPGSAACLGLPWLLH